MSILNYDCMKLDNAQKRQFVELVNFMMSQDKEISFPELQKHCGISVQQWEEFCTENRDELKDKLKSF